MELRHLRYFIAVAEHLHFSRAAEILHIAQPPLSQQIQSLENELGVPLFVRTRRSVQLTPAGKAFLDEAKKVIAQAEHAIAVAHQAHNGILGQLDVGFVGTAITEVLPTVLKAFREQYPFVKTPLHNLVTIEQVQALHEGWIQVGILHPPLLDASLHLEVIHRDPLVVVLPTDHALALQKQIALVQLCEETFVMYPRAWNPGLFDQMTSLCQSAGFHMHLGQEASGWESIISLVAANFGISIVPASSQLLRNAGVAYRPLQDVTSTFDLALAWLPDNASPILHNFLHVARERLMPAIPGRDNGV
ncbi:LysR family transcriptional regulator [Tengunoibacter tsumagoiensis]|uniref:LysR family transcriptional regulator n=1 Tax=Tengunoibacter tsumagoiensis TaxID=2014871 RepID=A0A402A8I7_9CHLR|nr:LysR family transcriptional regulator [Tengunoibacter tsumagoiensis]GCE15472.1 LysR family transcriptional regulator [Tengunoibacter tsumagoiensis]